jgi:hypothetical protein
MIANAVDADDARIVRRPACEIRDDSDLGDRLVTCAVPPLPAAAIAAALGAGTVVARTEIARGRIIAAVLSLQGRFAVVEGESDAPAAPARRRLETLSRSLVPC